jgi:hypothetical protein
MLCRAADCISGTRLVEQEKSWMFECYHCHHLRVSFRVGHSIAKAIVVKVPFYPYQNHLICLEWTDLTDSQEDPRLE